MTRWHGITSATGLVAHARATARVRGGLANRRGDLTIRARFPVRDGLQLPPHPPLKGGCAHVQRQLHVRRFAAQVLQQRADLRAQDAIVAAHRRRRILVAQILLERAIAVADHHPAHPAGRRRQQQPAEWRVGNREIDLDSGCAFTIRRGRHAERCAGALVQPAAGSISRVVHGRCDTLPFFERHFHLAEPAGLRERARRNPDDLRERALEMKPAQPYPPRQCTQRMARFGIGLNDLARTLYLFDLRIHNHDDKPHPGGDLSEPCSEAFNRRPEDHKGL
jgi:hypothetical protein